MSKLETGFWTSANDIDQEGNWIWESTLKSLYPWGGGNGYANWAIDQPCNNRFAEHCMEINLWGQGGWHDRSCSYSVDAICENQP